MLVKRPMRKQLRTLSTNFVHINFLSFGLLAILSSFLLCLPAVAQTNNQDTAVSPSQIAKHSLDLEADFGTLVPSHDGLSDIVPGWGLRAAIPANKGIFEVSAFLARGNGIIYRTGAVDYRMDIDFEQASAHFLLGLHADQYFQGPPNDDNKSFAGGWHFGGGVTLPVGGPLLVRSDFRYRIGPGTVLEVTVGVVYRIPMGENQQQ